jgi:hypothetical protein
MQRLHLFLAVVEAQCQVRIHRGALPLSQEEFDQLLRGMRAAGATVAAEEARASREALMTAGYLSPPPRWKRARRAS